MIHGPYRYGRYSNDKGGFGGPIRIWNAHGAVVADIPLTVEGYEAAPLFAEAPAMREYLEELATYPDDRASQAKAILARIDKKTE